MTKTSSYHTMLFRSLIKDECPEIIELVNQLQNYLNEEVMVDLNYKVDEEKQKTKDVAYNFLLENNLIK